MILAIGGSASMGKTTVASTLARRLDAVEVIHVDDLQKAVAGDIGRSFIETTPGVWHRSPEWLCDQLIRWTEKLHPALIAAIETHLKRPGYIIVEGEGVEPRLMARWDRSELRSVAIVGADRGRLA